MKTKLTRPPVIFPAALVGAAVLSGTLAAAAQAQSPYAVTFAGYFTPAALSPGGLVAGQFGTGGDYHGVAGTPGALAPIPTFSYNASALYDSPASGVNDSGQTVGYSTTGRSDQGFGISHAYLYGGGVTADLGTLGGDNSYATGINGAGQISGSSQAVGGAYAYYHAFLDTGGVMKDLGTLTVSGGVSYGDSYGAAVNAEGQVVGEATARSTDHAFFYDGRTMTDLGTLLGQGTGLIYGSSSASGLNDAGWVVGYSDTGPNYTNQHAFAYHDGAMHDLGTLDVVPSSGGGPPVAMGLSFAYGVNGADVVVGQSDTAQGGRHAFVYAGGRMLDLNALIAVGSAPTLTEAVAINGAGQILATDGYEAFLLTPTPEPSQSAALGLGALGLAGLGLRARKRAGSERV